MQTFDFKKVALVIGGRLITGFAEGEAITVERDEDTWTLQVGSDGEATRSKSNNRAGKVTFRVKGASTANAILTGFIKADELNNGGLIPMMLKDNSGASLYSAEQGYLVKPPSAGYGAEETEREYVYQTDNLIMFEGGNP